MSGQIVYRPEVHRCTGMPRPAEVGTVWRCDGCGTFWRVDEYREWTPPVFQRRLRRKYGTPEENQ